MQSQNVDDLACVPTLSPSPSTLSAAAKVRPKGPECGAAGIGHAGSNSDHVQNGLPIRQADPSADVLVTVQSFQSFLSFIVGISIFGASIFATIIGQLQDPRQLNPHAYFSMQTVRVFVAIAWLLFIAALGVAGFSSSVLILEQERNANLTGDWRRRWNKPGLVVSLMLQILVIGAFLFLSLGLVAYTAAVGWTAVATSIAAAAVAIFLLVKQCGDKL
ncbi:uncharacterized protein BO72DRAFT_492282 [Aspergillus fijiensis CBS 313.89]|uniref:Transmembrane protein n=1 Tax=Aspergillus fijiensis CBS 313.89 TaxID=1448319 RepID=A0A8G1W5P8_9EURO|nr:uncharacterized protein BO72DRAFT_492282 [Aspergillus fijiensis CBS 313.89]RAK81454.1 hypothetical protein BO72DRAFT_492282 [Aspergillus fijiensis CBS 313.89]